MLAGSTPSLKDYWTSGAIGPCVAQNLSLNWCSGDQNVTSAWWESKLTSIGDDRLKKSISLNIGIIAGLKITNESTALPFICEVILMSLIQIHKYQTMTYSAHD
jgi:hypothetical protein